MCADTQAFLPSTTTPPHLLPRLTLSGVCGQGGGVGSEWEGTERPLPPDSRGPSPRGYRGGGARLLTMHTEKSSTGLRWVGGPCCWVVWDSFVPATSCAPHAIRIHVAHITPSYGRGRGASVDRAHREVEYWIALGGLPVSCGGNKGNKGVPPHHAPLTPFVSTLLTSHLRMVVGLCRQEEGMICPIPLCMHLISLYL